MLSPTDIDKDNVIQVVVGCKSDLSSDRKVSPEMGQAQYIHKDSKLLNCGHYSSVLLLWLDLWTVQEP